MSSLHIGLITAQSAPGTKMRLAIEDLTQRVEKIETLLQIEAGSTTSEDADRCRRCNFSSLEAALVRLESAPTRKMRLAIEDLTQRVEKIETILPSLGTLTRSRQQATTKEQASMNKNDAQVILELEKFPQAIEDLTQHVENIEEILPWGVRILKGTVKPSENSFLATILGMDESLEVYLEACEKSIFGRHLSPEQWTMRFIDWKLDQLNQDETLSIEKQFESLGFMPSKASELSDLVRNNPLGAHWTPHQWATRYIELEFKYNTLLSGCRGFSSLECVESRDTDIDVEQELEKERN